MAKRYRKLPETLTVMSNRYGVTRQAILDMLNHRGWAGMVRHYEAKARTTKRRKP